MSENDPFGFARLVPGFDFLQNLAKGASQTLPQLPNLSSWVAPTLSVEELDKRIGELKAVHFWLEQNGKALGATIQALEVQKMTLATLQGMNFSMGDVASALKLKTAEKVAPGVQKAGKSSAAAGNGAAAPVDPMQWWGALTQQFQEIAANAMKDVAQKTAVDTAKNMAAGAARDAVKAAKKSAARASPARKRSPGKTS
jgi:hypothetical protein